uniref:Homeobox domain-containing protein n=1 Tax=Panagrolaimus sp. ES5 TaxID=591445 RepID=A0AC34EZS5_9BILA
MEFDDIFIQRKVNKFGGYYFNGKPLPYEIRKEIIRQLNEGIGVTQIGRNLQISHGAVSKIVQIYRATRSIEPKSRASPYARKVSSLSQKKAVQFNVNELIIDSLPQKHRNTFTEGQKTTLLEYFEVCPVPDEATKEEISKKTGLTDKQISTWFNNRRSRVRKALINGRASSSSASETSSITTDTDNRRSSSCESSIITTAEPSSPSSPYSFQLFPSTPSPLMSPAFSSLSTSPVANLNYMLHFQQILAAQYYLTALMQQMPQQK